jgi:hypothetical protein
MTNLKKEIEELNKELYEELMKFDKPKLANEVIRFNEIIIELEKQKNIALEKDNLKKRLEENWKMFNDENKELKQALSTQRQDDIKEEVEFLKMIIKNQDNQEFDTIGVIEEELSNLKERRKEINGN